MNLAHVTIMLMPRIVSMRVIHLDLKIFIKSDLPHTSLFLTLLELPTGRHRQTVNGGVSPNLAMYTWYSEAVRVSPEIFI